ncbi:MAG: hypothetical protein RLZZ626_192 [Actinomycetota bacterium]
MSGGDIAAIIAAAAFVLLVLFLAVPLLKLGRVLDETRNSIHDLTRMWLRCSPNSKKPFQAPISNSLA